MCGSFVFIVCVFQKRNRSYVCVCVCKMVVSQSFRSCFCLIPCWTFNVLPVLLFLTIWPELASQRKRCFWFSAPVGGGRCAPLPRSLLQTLLVCLSTELREMIGWRERNLSPFRICWQKEAGKHKNTFNICAAKLCSEDRCRASGGENGVTRPRLPEELTSKFLEGFAWDPLSQISYSWAIWILQWMLCSKIK